LSRKPTRETLKSFLRTKGSTDTFITYTRENRDGPNGTNPTGNGLGVDPGTGKELLALQDPAAGLLGDYVKYIVDRSNNVHKFKPGNSNVSSTNRGDDLTIADSHGVIEPHVKQGTELKSHQNNYSNSKQFDSSGTPLDALIDKVGKNFNNHSKLKDIKGRPSSIYGQTNVTPEGDQSDIVQATQRVFLANNRFANVGDDKSTSFTIKPQDPNEFDATNKESAIGSVTLQNKFGKYDKNEKKINFDDLKSLGASLLLKSSGFDLSDTPGNSIDPDRFDPSITTSAQNFDVNSGFTKLDIDNLRSKNSSGFPQYENANESFRSGRGESVEIDQNADSSKSYGSSYNDKFTFLGSDPKLHRIQAAVSMLALKNIAASFFGEFIERLRAADKIDLESAGESFVTQNYKGDLTTYMLGKSKELASVRIDADVFSNLLTGTTYPYGDAVNRGLEVIFGDITSNDIGPASRRKELGKSPGFWLAISRSILKTLDNVYKKYNLNQINSAGVTTEDYYYIYKDIIDSNKFIQFYNVMAVIGDISLRASGGIKSENYTHPRNVDAIRDNKAIPGKSRNSNGFNQNELSWSQDSTPSMYLLPANIIRAAGRLNNLVRGENPVAAMMGSKLVRNTFTGLSVDGSYNRIPESVVKFVEDQLDAEYVPFYIQDLRTNEIISFQAFLSALTDTINPNYTATPSYGRMDSVQIYQGTTRNLQVGFTVYATNKEDFDAMWFKINKFITLLYPQWTPGSMVSNIPGSKFYQPFSQVVGASPIVRLRIGDVIKSNYSRFGLARVFGIGDSGVSAQSGASTGAVLSDIIGVSLKNGYDLLTEALLKLWLAGFGSTQSSIAAGFDLAGTPNNTAAKIVLRTAEKSAIQLTSSLLLDRKTNPNGFANPLAVNQIINQLIDPNVTGDLDKHGYKAKDKFSTVELKANTNLGYIDTSGKRHLLYNAVKARVVQKGKFVEIADADSGFNPDEIGYKIICEDLSAGDLYEKEFLVRHCDIYPDPKLMFSASVMGLSLLATDPIAGGTDLLINNLSDKALASGVPNEIIDAVRTAYLREEGFFMRPEVNPYVRAFESTKGRGLAGVIKSVTFDWLSEFPWELDHNSRAPIGVKISFGFDVIHDLPPGLDHSGFNKAPLYNVGGIMKNISGDPYEDDGRQAKFNYNKERSKIKGTFGTTFPWS